METLPVLKNTSITNVVSHGQFKLQYRGNFSCCSSFSGLKLRVNNETRNRTQQGLAFRREGSIDLQFKSGQDTTTCASTQASVLPISDSSDSDNKTGVIRRLILLRHAKSSWDDPSLKDHDRPLSKRGIAAAGSIAGKLKEVGWLPNLILCSDALRTRQTLELMAEAEKTFRNAEVRFLGSFYSVAAMDGETVNHLQAMIAKYSQDTMSTVMCMGHNRGWEEAASELSGKQIELKTATAALLESKESDISWHNVWESGWKLVDVVGPDPA